MRTPLGSPRGRAPVPARAGRVPAWIPIALVLVGVALVVHRLDLEATRRGVASIDCGRYRLHAGGLWFGDAWRERLERVLARTGNLDARDEVALAELVADLEALPFVAEVGQPKVAWPDGLELPVRLREPLACVRIGDDFLPVSSDGVVLSGYAYAPHEVAGSPLPVLLPFEVRTAEPPLPGDALEDPRLLDALALAGSLRAHLRPHERSWLGRIVIDASSPVAFDGHEGGLRLLLEGSRSVVWGRSPAVDAPGELPQALKWAAVLEGLSALGEGREWDLLDVRWDEPEAYLRDGTPVEGWGRDG